MEMFAYAGEQIAPIAQPFISRLNFDLNNLT